MSLFNDEELFTNEVKHMSTKDFKDSISYLRQQADMAGNSLATVMADKMIEYAGGSGNLEGERKKYESFVNEAIGYATDNCGEDFHADLIKSLGQAHKILKDKASRKNANPVFAELLGIISGAIDWCDDADKMACDVPSLMRETLSYFDPVKE